MTENATKHGLSVLVGIDRMRTIQKYFGPKDSMLVVETDRGVVAVVPHLNLKGALGYSYRSQITPLHDTAPHKWSGALVYKARIKFDKTGRAIIGKRNPVRYGKLLFLLTAKQAEDVMSHRTPSAIVKTRKRQ